jgi:hypothetical protein
MKYVLFILLGIMNLVAATAFADTYTSVDQYTKCHDIAVSLKTKQDNVDPGKTTGLLIVTGLTKKGREMLGTDREATNVDVIDRGSLCGYCSNLRVVKSGDDSNDESRYLFQAFENARYSENDFVAIFLKGLRYDLNECKFSKGY